MIKAPGVGLAANQIGINKRVCVVNVKKPIVLINPKIVEKSEETFVFPEGCLSFPDVFLDVDRPESIVVKYEDEGKEIHKVKMEGFIARIFLHEYDHMEGIDFTERAK